MATIYQKISTDRTCILDPREYFIRAIDFGAWTEARIGFYCAQVSSSDDNAIGTTESVTVNSVADRISIGLKNTDTNDLPGEAGSMFLGAINGIGATANTNGASGYYAAGALGNVFSGVGYNGATPIEGTTSDLLSNFITMPADPSVASSYNGFFALKFVITNLGLSSQSVAISSAASTTISGTDYSASALRISMNNATYGTAVTIAWNSGVAAYDIPDGFWIRLPFYNNRLRLSVIEAIRYAP